MDDCRGYDYYDEEEDICTAFECYGLDCPALPCECSESEENDDYH